MNFKRSFWQSAAAGTAVFLIMAGAGVALAGTWAAPTSAPPAGNADAPLTVGAAGQIKAGGLTLGAGGVATGLIVQTGNVGIGTLSPSRNLTIDGQNAYMSFNYNGAEKWVMGEENTAGGRFVLYDDVIGNYPLTVIPSAGYLGVLTTNPSRPLEVNNAMKFTNGSSDINDGVIGAGTFAAGLNIVGINTDGTGRKINTWGSIIQNENAAGNSLAGNTVVSALCLQNGGGYVQDTGTGCRTTMTHPTGIVSADIPAGVGGDVIAQCPSSGFAVGGGYYFASSGGQLSTSRPVGSIRATGWECTRGAGAGAATCYAVCMN